jgi:LL-diaminopimelate aminotransferase
MVRRLVIDKADRLYHLPPAIDDFLPRRKGHRFQGTEVIDLARFQWPEISSLDSKNGNAGLATSKDISDLAEKTADWYQSRFGVKIKPQKEVFIGGSIRQILNLTALAIFNPGDLVLIPDPGVWHYRAAAVLASSEIIPYHLTERNRFRPVMASIPLNTLRLAKGMIVNSPHNPTGTYLEKEDLTELLRTVGRENLLLIHDQAYNGFLEGTGNLSLFALPGGRKVALEIYSFAYNFGRSGTSLGFAIGQPALISALRQTAAAFGLTVDKPQILGALEALTKPSDAMPELLRRVSRNRELTDDLCKRLRLIPAAGRTGPFYWARLPGRKLSLRFCRRLYVRCGILAVPGMAFGESGEGYIRFSLLNKTEKYQEAVEAAGAFYQVMRERALPGG